MNVMVSVAFLALYMAEVGLNKTYLEVLPLNVVVQQRPDVVDGQELLGSVEQLLD